MSQPEAWHLRKELSIGTMISLLSIGVGSVLAYADMKADLEHKASSTEVAVVQSRQMQFSSDISEIKADLKELLKEQRALTRTLEE